MCDDVFKSNFHCIGRVNEVGKHSKKFYYPVISLILVFILIDCIWAIFQHPFGHVVKTEINLVG